MAGFVPYNCHFIVAFKNKEGSYDIVEIYSTRSKIFGDYLKIDSEDNLGFFYSRRMDLNGTKFVGNYDQDVTIIF